MAQLPNQSVFGNQQIIYSDVLAVKNWTVGAAAAVALAVSAELELVGVKLNKTSIDRVAKAVADALGPKLTQLGGSPLNTSRT